MKVEVPQDGKSCALKEILSPRFVGYFLKSICFICCKENERFVGFFVVILLNWMPKFEWHTALHFQLQLEMKVLSLTKPLS